MSGFGRFTVTGRSRSIIAVWRIQWVVIRPDEIVASTCRGIGLRSRAGKVVEAQRATYLLVKDGKA